MQRQELLRKAKTVGLTPLGDAFYGTQDGQFFNDRETAENHRNHCGGFVELFETSEIANLIDDPMKKTDKKMPQLSQQKAEKKDAKGKPAIPAPVIAKEIIVGDQGEAVPADHPRVQPTENELGGLNANTDGTGVNDQDPENK